MNQTDPVKILLVEDNPVDVDLIRKTLEADPEKDFDVSHVNCLSEAVALLSTSNNYDVILFDLSVRESRGLESLLAVAAKAPDLPIIVMTGNEDGQVALQGVRIGAADYLIKGQYQHDVLVRSIRYAMERNRSASALRESQRRLLAIFDHSRDAILLADDTGRYVDANPAACKLTGYSREELLSVSVPDLVPEESRSFSQQVWAEFMHAGIFDGEMLIRSKSGADVTVELSATANIVQGLHLFILRDVSERHSFEKRLREITKMEAVSRLAGGMAHDFNNLLAVIMTYCSVLKDSVVSPAGLEDIEEIRKAATRGKHLVRRLLTFGRKQVLNVRLVDLNRVLEESEDMLKRATGGAIDIKVLQAQIAAHVQADVNLVENVLLNLALNARDAMPEGGLLTFSLTVNLLDEQGQLPGASKPGPHVHLEVRDTGMGIPDEVRPHIFEPFYTTKGPDNGTGLGLPTVYAIIKQLGGFIEVESAVGQGTAFHIHLPFVNEEEDVEDLQPEPSEEVPTSATILLVEDEPAMRRIVARTLRGEGYKVLEAAHGVAALELAAGLPREIHAIVTDVVMPHMNGPQLIRELRLSRPSIRVLYMSGFHQESTSDGAGRLDGWPFLQKPFSLDEVVSSVKELLGSRSEVKG